MKKLTGHAGGSSSSRSCRTRAALRAECRRPRGTAAIRIARTCRFVRRSAMAAGPIKRAVERIAPIGECGQSHRERQGEHVEQADDPDGYSRRCGDVRVHRCSSTTVWRRIR